MKRFNLIVPLAGRGQRMIDGGYLFPKPMIMVGERHIIDWSMQSIDVSECHLIFVVRKDHVCNFSIDRVLQQKYGEDIKLVVSDGDTAGSVSSCYLAKDLIDNDLPLCIYCPDVTFEPKFVPAEKHFKDDGFILTFKANSPNYSYVCTDPRGYVTKTAEKVVISENASVGIYCFRSGKLFVQLAEEAFQKGLSSQSHKEFFVAPLYNQILARGGKVTTSSVDRLYVMGTPEEMDFFKRVVWPFLLPRQFVLCCDHSGYKAKEIAREILMAEDDRFIDCGSWSTRDCDYSDYIAQAVETQRTFPGAMILGFCKTGQGVNIAANKFRGIRAALVTNEQYAEYAIRHNAANFFSIPAEMVDVPMLHRILEVLRTGRFDGGRHQNRLMKIDQEKVGC